ncbi:MAG: pyridoxamine 5'-phosphate oxidase family protein [candidate division Zixibacteria bacterium]|nr:pyridoxamine 5'-phosphate oxidase family protein [candidate division Zixibacteria bacterium]
MSQNEAQFPKLRRSDRQVADDEWIRRFLERAPYAIVALHQEGYPHLVSNIFYYERATNCIYLHGAKEGETRRAIERDPRATLTATRMGRLLPAKTATNMSVEYESVQVRGRVEIMTDIEQATEKMQSLVNKYFPHLRRGADYAEIARSEIEHITAYCLQIESWQAKRKQERADFPGAFRFGEHGFLP